MPRAADSVGAHRPVRSLGHWLLLHTLTAAVLAGAAEIQLSPAIQTGWAEAIAGALSAAAHGDTTVAVFAPGRYTGCIPDGLVVSSDLVLRGSGGASATTVDCSGSGRHLNVSSGASLTVEGLTLTGGTAADERHTDGGCILIEGLGTAVTVRQSVLTGCRAGESGGAIALGGGALSVVDSNLTGNIAMEGGGISASAGSEVQIRNAIFEGNVALLGGGGVYLSGCSVLVDRCVFENNNARLLGGGAVLSGMR